MTSETIAPIHATVCPMHSVQVPRSWWLDDVPEVGSVHTSHTLAGATADVVVVGLGASGLEAVALLGDRGVDVLGVDAVGVAGGAAGANGGFLLAGMAEFHHDAVAHHGRDVALAWWWRTVEELDRVAAIEPSVRRVGSLRVAASPAEHADIRMQLAAMRSDGLGAQAYEGPEGVGLLVPGDGAVHPVARCGRLAARAVAAGARLVAPARVQAVGPGVVWAAGHRVTCRAVLVCVDGGLEHLRLVACDDDPATATPAAGLTHVRSARLQMLATAPTSEVSLPRPVYRRHGYDYVQQLPTGEVLLGGGRDVGGSGEWADSRDPGLPLPSPAVQAHLDGWLAQLGVRAPVLRRWAAWAAFTDDRLPVDAEVAPGVHVVGGYSGHGNLIGGMLAREVAHAIMDRGIVPRP